MINDKIVDSLDWPGIAAQLDQEGYALLPGLLGADRARALANLVETPAVGRRVSLASENLGRGNLFYLAQPLPEPLAAWRHAFYRRLAPIGNRWNALMGAVLRYPAELDEFQQRNRQAGQQRGQSSFSRLREDDYQALHQLADGEQVFPLQMVALLSEPGRDFSGGEFVMTEQRPRMQSRPMVLPLGLGDAAIIAVAHRPCEGSKGCYRVNLKHAISRVRGGERIGLEVLFHDAPVPPAI